MRNLRAFLLKEREARKTIYPRGPEIFAALDLTPLEDVRVVIIGQDPYHGPNQAHGLCFSVQPGVEEPPSLLNIFQEINSDMSDPAVPGGRADGHLQPGHGCLTSWAQAGRAVVERGADGRTRPRRFASGPRLGDVHRSNRRESSTREREGLVFMLWGSYAQKKGAIVDRSRHCVLSSPHPSPLSAHRGFFGCRHFSKANRYLVSKGKAPIDWFAVE